LSVPLKLPAGYTPNDGSVGDLDGDGEYEIVLKCEQRPRDTASLGLTGETILQAYKLNGTLLWTINLGRNIREGAHYTQFMVYDLDGDGRAEVVDHELRVVRALADVPAEVDRPEQTAVQLISLKDRLGREARAPVVAPAADHVDDQLVLAVAVEVAGRGVVRR